MRGSQREEGDVVVGSCRWASYFSKKLRQRLCFIRFCLSKASNLDKFDEKFSANE